MHPRPGDGLEDHGKVLLMTCRPFILGTLPCPGYAGRLVAADPEPTFIDTGAVWTVMWPEYEVVSWYAYAVGERDGLWGDWSAEC